MVQKSRKPADVRHFELVTHWYIDADIETVWEALHAPESYPRWWRYVERVSQLQAGDSTGVGAVYHYTWNSRLPYELSFEMQVTQSRRLYLIEAQARGELDGVGRWQLSADTHGTQVRYDWCVNVTRPWMRKLAPLMAPVFHWNHGQVMAAGERGLNAYVGSEATVTVQPGVTAGRADLPLKSPIGFRSL